MPQQQEGVQAVPQMKPCPFCGEQIMETAKKCKHCGEFLDPDNSASVKEASTSEKNLLKKQQIDQSELSEKSRIIYIILDAHFGILGLHNMYAGLIARGILQLLLTCTIVGLIITIPWSLLELFLQTKDSYGRKMRS